MDGYPIFVWWWMPAVPASSTQEWQSKKLIVLPALAGKTHRDHFVGFLLSVVCCEKRVNINGSIFHMLLMDFNQSWVWMGWICENGLIWKSDLNQTWFIDIICEPSYVHAVKGHLRSTCKITWKCKFWLICILKDQLELP